MKPLYNVIGSSYGTTRRADPFIARTLATLLSVEPGKNYLDLACGTGNYTKALASIGGHWHGSDISEVMIRQAQSGNREVQWQVSSASALPYPDAFFDGAMCTLAVHHFQDLLQPFREVRRTLRQGNFVLFTAFPEQMRRYWLCHYFPGMMELAIAQMPGQDLVRSQLESAGFSIERAVPFNVTNALQDLFLYSGKERPELYFNPAIRANMSSFASLCSHVELNAGMQKLHNDLASGSFSEIAASYQSQLGDYAYIEAKA